MVTCDGNPPITVGFPSQRPMTRNTDVVFCVHLNKRLSNSRCVGDLRRHRAYFDVIVMKIRIAGHRNIFTCCNDASGYYKVSFSCNLVSDTASDYWQTLLWSNKKPEMRYYAVSWRFINADLMRSSVQLCIHSHLLCSVYCHERQTRSASKIKEGSKMLITKNLSGYRFVVFSY